MSYELSHNYYKINKLSATEKIIKTITGIRQLSEEKLF